jgi:sugar/nucleoside kinase (ribokinase family)
VGSARRSMNVSRTRNRRVVCGAGLVVLDLLVFDELDSIPAYAGGTCGNVLVILAFFGWASYPISRLGCDAIGERLLRDLCRFDVRKDLLVMDPKISTPVIIQQNRRLPSGDVSHRFVWRQCPQCGEFLPAFRPPTRAAADGLLDRLASQDVFVFDRVAPSTLALAEASAARGALVVFEPSRNTEDRHFERALKTSHIVKYSRDRISSLRWPRGYRPWIEVQTLGRDGLRFRMLGKRWEDLKALRPPGDLHDTSGAGDWTTAGLIDRLSLRSVQIGDDAVDVVHDSLRYGQSLAAINCCFYGARGAMYALTLDAIEERAKRLLRGSPVRGYRAADSSTMGIEVYSKVFCSSCVDVVGAS